MSGPKLMELRRLRREARRQANADRCAELDSAYARVYAAFAETAARLEALRDPLDFALIPPDQAAQEARAELAEGRDESAAARYDRRWRFAQDSVEQARLRLANRLLSLRLRLDLCLRNRDELHARRARALDRLQTADSSKDQASSELRVSLPLSEEDVERLESAETALQRERVAVEALEAEVEAHTPVATAIPAPVAGRSLVDWLGSTPVKEVDSFDLSDSLSRLLEEAKIVLHAPVWREWQQRAAAIARIHDPEERVRLEEDFLVDAQARLRDQKTKEACRARVEAGLDRASVFPELKSHACVQRLRALELTDTAEADRLLVELESAINLAQEAREREDRRRAVIESLKELGYEVHTELQTGHVTQGRLVFHKPPDAEYGVELVTDPGSQRFQTAMVRYAKEEGMSEQQRLRDQEREEAWCGDHARLRARLLARGWEVDLRVQHAPGRHPVRVIVDPHAAAARAARPAAPSVRQRSQSEANE